MKTVLYNHIILQYSIYKKADDNDDYTNNDITKVSLQKYNITNFCGH